MCPTLDVETQLPVGFRSQMAPDGTIELIEGPSVNGTTALSFVVGTSFSVAGLIALIGAGPHLDKAAGVAPFVIIGLPLALIGGYLLFLRRRWRLNPVRVSYDVATWLLPLSARSDYGEPAEIEIRHQLTRGAVSVDLLVLRTSSGGELLIDAADNAPSACFKVIIWRGLQIGFNAWTTGQASRRRPPSVEVALQPGERVSAYLSDLEWEIAPRIVALARFVSAATLVPTRVVIEPHRRRIFSIGSD
jgi:hypothetical protein